MWSRISVILRKELIQVFRDPRSRVLLFGPPLIQLIIFGYAVNLDVTNNRLGWWDRDQSPESRQLLSRFEGATYFEVTHYPGGEEEVGELLDRGLVEAVVRVPADFSTDLNRQREAELQILVDGSNSNTAAIVSNYIGRVLTVFQQDVLSEQVRFRFVGSPVPAPMDLLESGLVLESRVWFNQDLRSQDYFVPGVVVNIIGLVTVMLTAMAIVREKEIGTMEQLMVTPISPLELMLGKTLPFALIGILEVILVTGAALLVFDVPFRGSWILLLVCSCLFLLSTLGTGLLISTFSQTQQQAMMGSFFFFLPVFMLSGFVFPIRNMPEVVQYLTYLNAVRYFIEIVRGLFLKGIGFSILWPQMLALAAIGVAMIAFSALRFRKRLD